MVLLVLWTHDIARIAGPLWVMAWILYYAIYRRRNGRPVLRSLPRDWNREHIHLLEEAEERDSLELFAAGEGAGRAPPQQLAPAFLTLAPCPRKRRLLVGAPPRATPAC